jgi:hypothetical protein
VEDVADLLGRHPHQLARTTRGWGRRPIRSSSIPKMISLSLQRLDLRERQVLGGQHLPLQRHGGRRQRRCSLS